MLLRFGQNNSFTIEAIISLQKGGHLEIQHTGTL